MSDNAATPPAATPGRWDEFLGNLASMATGDYLRDDEREFWEPPFPATAIDDITACLMAFDGTIERGRRAHAGASTIDSASATPAPGPSRSAAVETEAEVQLFPDYYREALTELLRELDTTSRKHGGGVVEDEEITDIAAVVAQDYSTNPAVTPAAVTEELLAMWSEL